MSLAMSTVMEPFLDRHDRLARAVLIVFLLLGLLTLVGIALGLIVYLADIFWLFFIAWIIAFLLYPVATTLVRRMDVRWSIAVTTLYLAMLVLVSVVVWIVVPIAVLESIALVRQFGAAAANLPGMMRNIEVLFARVGIPVDLAASLTAPDVSARIADAITTVARSIIAAIPSLVGLAGAAILAIVLSYFMLLNGDEAVRRFLVLVPESQHSSVCFFLATVTRVFGAYSRGYLLIMLLYGLGTAIVMLALRLPFALPLGIVSGLLMIVPIVGGIVAIAPPIILAVATGTLLTVAETAVLLATLQFALFYLVAPRIFARAVGFGPIWVFFALLLGFKLAGLLGVIFGIPIAAVVYTVALCSYEQWAHARPDARSAAATSPRSMR